MAQPLLPMARPLQADTLLADGPWAQKHGWSARDAVIYNLGIGFGAAAVDDPRLLPYVLEEEALAFPTMAGVVNMDDSPLLRPAYGIDLAGMLHGEEAMEILRPLPATCQVAITAEIEHLWDKGAERGAILRLRRTLVDTANGDALAIVRSTLLLRGTGGFGGSAAGAPRQRLAPDRPADGRICATTRPEQALLYRLTGDRNPLHSDPPTARAAGFPRPILMGLCSLGIAARVLTARLADGDAACVRAIEVRFAGIVFPGDSLDIHWWTLADGAFAFEARVIARDALVLSGGRIRFG